MKFERISKTVSRAPRRSRIPRCTKTTIRDTERETVNGMANNVFIYNGALEGATAGINERWLTSVNASDYAAIKNTVANFADTVDSFIPTDPTMTSADGGLMQSICAAVLSNRFLKITDNITQIAHVVVALYEAIRPELLPELTVTITSDQVINLSTVPGVTVTNALNNLETQ